MSVDDKERLRSEVLRVLETIADPEIGIDVVNLGLIYDIQLLDNRSVKIKMTLTSAFCPLSTYLPLMIIDQLKEKLNLDADVDLVYDPPWTPLKMTEKGRALFKERFGYDIVELYKQTTEGQK